MAAQGTREITLLGQNVNAWHGAGADGAPSALPACCTRWPTSRGSPACATPPRTRATWTTTLIAAHRDLPALMPFLHLPVQSGSDRMLTAMNRGHTAADYLSVIDRLRAARPDLALSSDFIVGHPGETEADFEATMALVGAVGFAQAFSFKYSPRPGTPAAGAGLQVPERIKDRRLHALQALLARQQAAFNASCVGLTIPVLFTRAGRHPGQVVGRAPWLQPVHCRAGHR